MSTWTHPQQAKARWEGSLLPRAHTLVEKHIKHLPVQLAVTEIIIKENLFSLHHLIVTDGEGDGTTPVLPCLEHPMDGGA